MKLEDLAIPFKESEIEWRIGQCGVKGNGQVWAKCLAYVQSRAIMDRLDKVCGPENWMVTYDYISTTGSTPGVMCNLSIRLPDLDGVQWITKQDGAEQTDIEAFKGGISSALKRAGVVWGIGRYLYGLEEGFATIVEQGTTGALYGKTKEGKAFHWLPPSLPAWALPQGEQTREPIRNRVVAETVAHGDGLPVTDGVYRIPKGKYAKRTFEEIDVKELRGYVEFLENAGKISDPVYKELVDKAIVYIVKVETGEHPVKKIISHLSEKNVLFNEDELRG